MHLFQRGVLLAVTAGALAFPTFPSHQPAPPAAVQAPPGVITTADAGNPYSEDLIEHYLASDQIAFLRPGYNLKIVSFTNVGPGKKPVVEFTLTDDLNQPLDRLGALTPGPCSTSFVFGKWDPKARYYVPYTTRTSSTGIKNPSADSGGTYEELAIGRYKYTFGTTLPADMDVAATNTLGAYGRRTMNPAYLEKDYYAPNVFLEVRADGGTPGAVWAAMDVSTCNNCHDPLALHGGTRRTVKNCMLCHSKYIQNDTESGETFDGKVFFHKLHRGASLPSVIAGKPYIAGGDWSTVGYPQDMRNCTTCHQPTAVEKDIWYTRLSRAVCGSCHDDIDWTTGTGHYGMPQRNDNSCINCHEVTVDAEWDDSVIGAHTVPAKSKQLKGLNAEIVSVANFVPGQKPTVTYKITNNDKTPVDGNKLNTFAPILAGPTSDYSTYWRENAIGKGVYDAAAGTTTYTFTNAIPATAPATDTWTVSLDAYRNVVYVRGDGKPDITSPREAVMNPIWYGSLTAGGTAAPRRAVVDIAKCNRCHDKLGLHGPQRFVIAECVLCHNPTMTDTAQRLPEFNPPESIDMKRMVHRIHVGEELEGEFTIYGNGRSRHNYNEVRYPGDRRNCVACHTGTMTATNAAFNLPTGGKLDTVTPRDYYTPQGPGTASCLGCHDKRDYASHAKHMTADGVGESCAACHGPNNDWSPTKSHAR